MIYLDRSTAFNHAGRTYRINDTYREFNKAIATIAEFAIYAPTKQVLPLVKNESGRVYFTHWDNLRPIPFGQIELFTNDDADPDEPDEPPELDDTPKSKRLVASDIQLGSFWRSRSGLHPITPVVGLLRAYVVRCDDLPKSEQIKMCQIRIKQQRSYLQNLKEKSQLADINFSINIIKEEKSRILRLLR